MARVYLRTADPPGGDIHNVTGTLIGLRLDGRSPGGPPIIRSLNSISVGSDADLNRRRDLIDKSLNFELPPEWITEGALHLQLTRIDIERVSSPLPCENCNNLNEFGLQRVLRFNAAPPLRVVLWNVPYTTGGTTFEPRDLDFDFLESWLRRAYPTARVLASRQCLAPLSGRPGTDFEAADVNHRLNQMRTLCVDVGPFDVCVDTQGRQVHWYGMVSDARGFMRGRARGIPGVVASGPAGANAFSWDTDGSYAD